MSTVVLPPKFPAGEFQRKPSYSAAELKEFTSVLRNAPKRLRQAVAELTSPQLDTLYKNWTIRQIAHHLADSHINAFTRFKLALTEDVPTIKPYNETLWSELADAKSGPVEPSLAILDGIHARWSGLIDQLSSADFKREFHHPELGRQVSLAEALAMYAWHCEHHLAQIDWLREQRGF